MRNLWPLLTLVVSFITIIATPWPTARELWSPHSVEHARDVAMWLDPLSHANYPQNK